MRYIVCVTLVVIASLCCLPSCGGDDPECKVDKDCGTSGEYVCVAGTCKVAPTPSR